MRMEKIGDIIRRSLKKLEIEHKLKGGEIFLDWKEIAGNLLSRNVQPLRVDNGVLFLLATSSTWMNELRFFREPLMERINGRLGEGFIREIRASLGRIHPGDSSRGIEPPEEEWSQKRVKKKIRPRKNLLSREEILKLRAATEMIQDPELREGFERIIRLAS